MYAIVWESVINIINFFIKLYFFAENTTHLKEVAYGKKSYQSSTYNHGNPYSSHLAVDGNIHTMIHTYTENSPYWEVDLGRIYRIKRVEIYNRRDCCGKIQSFRHYLCILFLPIMCTLVWYGSNTENVD